MTATGAGGSTIDHTGATTAGPQGYGHTGSTTVNNANTGQTRTTSYGGNDHYADASGNVYKGSPTGGWQQNSASGWSRPSGDTASMDRESQARSAGEQRTGSFASSGGGGRFGGGEGGARGRR